MNHSLTDVSSLQFYFVVFIFLTVYLLVLSERWNRAVLALAGAVLVIFVGAVDMERAFKEHIEWGTIALLIGMMMIVSIANQSGVFEYIAIKAAKSQRGNPLRILIVLSTLTAVSSAFLDNVTTVLLIVPVTVSIARTLGVNPVPYLICEIISSNIGGTATLVGDPPNMMIGGANLHLSFNDFLFHLGPVAAFIQLVSLTMLACYYRDELRPNFRRQQELMEFDERACIKDPVLMWKSVVVLAMTLLGFIFHSAIQVEASVIAMSGAALLMLIALQDHEIERVLGSLEWITIFFFIGLFVLVGGLVEIGLIRSMAVQTLELTNGNFAVTVLLILWFSGLASATIDNIPFVATMLPLIQDIGYNLGLDTDGEEMNVLWWALALGACLGGNGTLFGASANMIVAGLASRYGHGFGYMDFLKVGAPITLLSLLLATLYLIYRYLPFSG
ncbi:ArsB/NhaD family transporter [Bacillaceae bacterium]